ncbi:MAG TPA: MerR family transcriptional regulator [Gemmatimonadales bacterium]|nr:MerR family transcriptional regulator [Gemmatimonadales bacterium]
MGDRYPGSDREIGDRLEPPEPVDWGKPKMFKIGPDLREFYTVGQLAAALHRSPVTIRKWERLGYIPIASFRTPGQVRQKARRLYSREQLEIIVSIAADEGLMDGKIDELGILHPRRGINETKFTARVAEALKRLAQ